MTKSTCIIFLFFFFIISIPGISQTSHFSFGADLIYSYSPVKARNYSLGVTESQENWKGNFSPGIELQYGNKLAGVFRSGYIRYLYLYDNFSYSAVDGGTYYTDQIESTVNNIYTEFYLEYAFFDKSRIFIYAGPAMVIPVRIKQSTTNTVESDQNTRTYYNEEIVNAPYIADFQCVVGIGGRILIDKKSAICLESNFRFGIKKKDTDYLFDFHDYDTRTYSIQFIIGYQRNFIDNVSFPEPRPLKIRVKNK